VIIRISAVNQADATGDRHSLTYSTINMHIFRISTKYHFNWTLNQGVRLKRQEGMIDNVTKNAFMKSNDPIRVGNQMAQTTPELRVMPNHSRALKITLKVSESY